MTFQEMQTHTYIWNKHLSVYIYQNSFTRLWTACSYSSSKPHKVPCSRIELDQPVNFLIAMCVKQHCLIHVCVFALTQAIVSVSHKQNSDLMCKSAEASKDCHQRNHPIHVIMEKADNKETRNWTNFELLEITARAPCILHWFSKTVVKATCNKVPVLRKMWIFPFTLLHPWQCYNRKMQ